MATTIDSSAVSLRAAELGDLDAVERLLGASDLPVDGVRETIQHFLVAVSGDAVVGVVGMEYCGDFGLLRSTAVDPAWRGQRIAQRLVERIIADAESRGVHALYLLTTTAERYFPSFGFTVAPRDDAPEPIRQTSEFRGACPSSATMMALRLRVPRE